MDSKKVGRILSFIFNGVIYIMLTLPVLGMLLGHAIPAFNGVRERARMLEASNNARQIVIALKTYATDHQGQFPDLEIAGLNTSNDVFRELIKRDLLKDEKVFGAPISPFEPDGKLGDAPGYANAVSAGENHWSLVRGLTNGADGQRAFVFENPEDDTIWPPVWNADVNGEAAIGRAWKGGKIVIARMDGSVNPEPLHSAKGSRITPSDEDNAKLFPPGGSFLPVAK